MRKTTYILTFIFLVFLSLLKASEGATALHNGSTPEKEIKTLVLIIASDGTQAYLDLQKIWKAYMNLDPDHFEVYFIRGDPNVSSYAIKGNDLIVKTEESYKPGILIKTVLSIEALYSRLDEFDFVLRTNLSSFYVFPRLLNFLKTLPKTKCCSGVVLGCLPQWGLDASFKHFVSGAGIIMSADLAKMMVDEKETIFKNSREVPDDVLIGWFFQNKHIPFYFANRKDFSNRLDWYSKKKTITDHDFHFRAKAHFSERSSAEDCCDELFINRQLLKLFYSISLDHPPEKSNHNKKILLGVVIKNNDGLIPPFLKVLEHLKYDKKLIHLQISNCNDSPLIKERLKNWIEKNGSNYGQVSYTDFALSTTNTSADDQGGQDQQLIRKGHKFFGDIKNTFLSQAKSEKCDYCFIVESDVYLAPSSLAYLIDKNRAVISPLVRPFPHAAAHYRNFYVETTENGYYKDHPDYLPIAYNRKIGTFKVGCVSSVYLIQADYLDKLTFDDGANDWEALSFCRSANKNHVDQYICNEMEFGYFLHYDRELSREDEKGCHFSDQNFDFYDYLFDPESSHEASGVSRAIPANK